MRQRFATPLLLARGQTYAYRPHPEGTRLYHVIAADKLSRRSRRRWRRRGTLLGVARDTVDRVISGPDAFA